jgi:hypothetical protein
MIASKLDTPISTSSFAILFNVSHETSVADNVLDINKIDTTSRVKPLDDKLISVDSASEAEKI